MDTTFSEPCGWALNWEGMALSDVERPGPQPGNGNGARSFEEPNGWALCWDGAVLAENMKQEAARAQRGPV